MMFCPHCGKEMPADAKFCANCGKSILSKPQENPKQSNVIIPVTTQSYEPIPENTNINNNSMQKSGATALQKKQPKTEYIIVGIAIAVILIAVVGRFAYSTWFSINFPGVNPDAIDVKTALAAGSSSTTLPVGNTYDQSVFPLTPLEITYKSGDIVFDQYDNPYASIILEITCISGKWKPEDENVTFFIDGSASLSSPQYDDEEIKRDETAHYVFTQPLFDENVTQVSMQLTFKCATGATIYLTLPIDDVQEYFKSTYPDTEIGHILDEYAGTYMDGVGNILFVGSDEYGNARALLHPGGMGLPEPIEVILYGYSTNEYGWACANGNDYELLGGSQPHYDMKLGFYGTNPDSLTVDLNDIYRSETIEFSFRRVGANDVPYANPYYVN